MDNSCLHVQFSGMTQNVPVMSRNESNTFGYCRYINTCDVNVRSQTGFHFNRINWWGGVGVFVLRGVLVMIMHLGEFSLVLVLGFYFTKSIMWN